MLGLQEKAPAIVSIPCWRRCGKRVRLAVLEDGSVSCFDSGDRLIHNSREFEDGVKYVAVCRTCLTDFAPLEEITGAGFEICCQCFGEFVLILKRRNGEIGIIGGKATCTDNPVPLLADVICNTCLKRLGFWGRLLRAAKIEFAIAMG
ncbi:MAG: hypothetical protein UY23_C0002G0067 [Candidatus Jorgensenbacteria bacterium GW2011_GWA1_48_11]|uniref:Uncharacterized protein n=1 Tax=Candidatus Jorgensenbacteria bacterium GW2011_GWA1_48_11 TaxID=1618660 RepID=A0A0G1WLW3_9BACT|nr:MAG: hypothetical protein UY23_C0002G0067 [Candidatus Jorgensenbacteria bacterium GW2011_GWA1_48_11]KKW12766.1 MAG: hypothetical protein UY51_C0001G0066 [Candidatus Jorgensenbacteria bacterium GW2011_GWB1_49_9]